MSRITVLTLVVFTVLGLAPGLDLAGTKKEKVKFPDPGLEAAVRMAVGQAKGDLDPEALAKLADLITNAQKIKTLQGIEQCPELVYLHVGFNEITDLTPVTALAKLDELVASNNKITDLAPLSKLTSITRLDVSNNQIVDLAPLAGMTQLISLKLETNQIVDLAPLSGLTNLKRLHLDHNQITDLAPLLDLCDHGGLGPDSTLTLTDNPLSPDALATQVPALEAQGVKVKK